MIYISLQANLKILELHHSTFPYIIATSHLSFNWVVGLTTSRFTLSTRP